ncbi:unnamed protein product [Caenorhabditis brenneri]
MVRKTRAKTKNSNAGNPVNSDFDSLLKSMDDFSKQIETQIRGIKSRLDELDGGVVSVKFRDFPRCNCRRFRSKTFNGVGRLDPLGPLIEKFTSHRSGERSNLRFYFNGRRVSSECTPDSFGVELDEEVMEIEVYRGQPCSFCFSG